MRALRHTYRSASPTSAAIARGRLLADQARHRAPVRAAISAHAVSAVISPAAILSNLSTGLSPDEQRFIALQTAAQFQKHYVQHITHLDQAAVTVATLLSRGTTDPALGDPQLISVDAQGNVSVTYHGATLTQGTLRRRVVSLALVAIAVIMLACLI